MSKLTPKQQDIVQLANKKGSDADLFVLNKVHEVEDKIPDLDKVLASVRGAKGEDSTVAGPKGDKGNKGDSISGPRGLPGKDGLNGKDGKDGKDGQNGADGADGKDGRNADETSLVAQIQALRDEFEARLGEFETKSNESASKGQPIVYGPGKTKLIVLDLSAKLDGSTKTFVIGTHFGIVNVSSSSAPFGAFRPVIDYKEVGRNIVFDPAIDAPSALAAGQSLIITYLR